MVYEPKRENASVSEQTGIAGVLHTDTSGASAPKAQMLASQ
jgi:hypothetical protein